MYNNYGGLALPDPSLPDPVELPSIPTFSPVPKAPYVHPALTPKELNKRRARLNSETNGFHPSWQALLKIPLTNSTLIFLDCKYLYPLPRHQEALAVWRMRNSTSFVIMLTVGPYISTPDLYPNLGICVVSWQAYTTGNSPGTGFDLLNMRGSIGDTQHPPHELLELIAAAINGSPNKALTSREIRLSLMVRYTYFVYQDYAWHLLVTATLRNNPGHFSSVPRVPTLDDPGYAWKLRAVWLNKRVYERPGGKPLKATVTEPPFQISYPIALGPDSRTPGVDYPRPNYSPSLCLTPVSIKAAGQITLPPLNTLGFKDGGKKPTGVNSPESKRKTGKAKKGEMLGTLSVDEVRTGWTGIARRSLDATMRERGRDLLKEWENSTANNA